MTIKQQYIELLKIPTKELVKIAEDYKKAGIAEEVAAKTQAYYERNQLVAYLSKLYPAHKSKHLNPPKGWDNNWLTIICVHTPQGQATWHIHKSERKYFSHLKNKKDHWDGHTSEEKYDRLAKLK